jgi:hypothetical protein
MFHKTAGIGGVASGLGVLVVVLIGSTASISSNYWREPVTIAALGIACVLFAVGLWALSSVNFGLAWPDTHEERMEKRDKREFEAQLARYAFRDTLYKLSDELEANRRDIGAELANNRRYVVHYSSTAWEANRHALDASK